MSSQPVSFTQAEPAIFIGLLQALVQSLLGVVTVFGLDLTAEQVGAIHGFAAALLAVVGAIWTRGQVASVASLNALAAEGHQEPSEVSGTNSGAVAVSTALFVVCLAGAFLLGYIVRAIGVGS